MFIYIKLLNGGTETKLEVSPLDSVSEIKSRLAYQLNVPVNQQKLVLKGKPLLDGSVLHDYDVIEGTKLHLIVSKNYSLPSQTTTTDQINNRQNNSGNSQHNEQSPLMNNLRAVATKWLDPHDTEALLTAFHTELKNVVDQLSLDDIEKLCADRVSETL
ncbi:unnamed protein product [Didymodactylos carnosus]|uniref:Ubiquitin-like domain-containing protein n=1 Tax=Didymodactylos carnosus TaxID=1234261 RepID=A0A813PA29_9BILA|nr:unnamed protein product [Didymodactylos carnosus]CAF0833997.1 unnamed protein product [Didymodactylos carnosus]CAF3529903.1 unnamed protein product [Didymodactylos carnosus]CAF3618650.1 unnamed protein product [Didymodactylos carnosus]